MYDANNMQAVYAQLTKKQRSIFDYILSNTEEVCFLSLRELSRRVGASEVSVLKLCKALDYEGFRDLKESLRRNMQLLPGGEHGVFNGAGEPVEKRDILGDSYKLELANLSDTLAQLRSGEMIECARELLQAKKAFVFGHDISRINAEYMAYRLNFLRVKSEAVELGKGKAVQAVESMDGDSFAIFFSFPLYYAHMSEMVARAKRTGAKIITITDSYNSPAVTEGARVFLCKTTTPHFHNSHLPPMLVVELLTACVAAEMGERLDKIHEQINRFINEGPAGVPLEDPGEERKVAP